MDVLREEVCWPGWQVTENWNTDRRRQMKKPFYVSQHFRVKDERHGNHDGKKWKNLFL